MAGMIRLENMHPYRELEEIGERFNRLFGGVPARRDAGREALTVADWVPRVDIHEEKDRFVVLADVPGVEPKDIDITAENGVLTVRGERRAEKRETENGYERVERVSGAFLRRFTLPEGANTESIKAKQTNGVLEVTIPKTPAVQPRRISIDS